jgi:rubredoxin
MTDDNGKKTEDQTEESTSKDEDGRVTDAETAFEEYATDKKCPECGDPIIDVRSSCPNCGYEYQESDYSDKEAGSEFVAGSAIDDEGNEVPDHETGGGEEQSEEPGLQTDDDGDEDDDDSSDTSSDSSDDSSDSSSDSSDGSSSSDG